ncbi:MAG: DUF3226 domain-containing protein [Planctomycetota bacterium]
MEGPHDIEFAARLLRRWNLHRVKSESRLDRFWEDLIPRTYPPKGDLLKRVPVPLFLQNDSHSIAIHGAIGDTRIVHTVEENCALIDVDSITGIGLILDSDTQRSPADRYDAIRGELDSRGFMLPEDLGTVASGAPRFGAFVLPDNTSTGTLEDLLLECASLTYPNLLASAKTHIANAVDDPTLDPHDRADFNKPAGRNKAIVGSIASVLRPGKAIQVSIQDNRWVNGETLKRSRIRAIQEFLVSLLELP